MQEDIGHEGTTRNEAYYSRAQVAFKSERKPCSEGNEQERENADSILLYHFLLKAKPSDVTAYVACNARNIPFFTKKFSFSAKVLVNSLQDFKNVLGLFVSVFVARKFVSAEYNYVLQKKM